MKCIRDYNISFYLILATLTLSLLCLTLLLACLQLHVP